MTEMKYIYFVHVYKFYKKFIRSGKKVQVYCGKSSVFFFVSWEKSQTFDALY